MASFFKIKASLNQISVGKWGHQDHSKPAFFYEKISDVQNAQKSQKAQKATKRKQAIFIP